MIRIAYLVALLTLLVTAPAFSKTHHHHHSHHQVNKGRHGNMPPLDTRVLKTASALECVTQAVYHEERNSKQRTTRIKVADTVISRTGLSSFSNTPCGVISQIHHYHHRTVHEFSWYAPKFKREVIDKEALSLARNVARERLNYFIRHPHRTKYLYFASGHATPGIQYKHVIRVGSFRWYEPKKTSL